MEHIVQFAIGIDDDAIVKRIKESAYNDVVKQLLDEAKKDLRLTGSYWTKESWSIIVDRALRNYLDENKDTIINLAAQKLADSYRRTKAYKEAMGEVLTTK